MSSPCPHRDQVVAHFLDGDSSWATDAEPTQLAEHLDACPECRDYLAQGRRLDAVLAATSGTEIDAQVADRILAGVEAETRDVSPARPAWWRRLAPRAALIAAGFLGAILLDPFGTVAVAPESPVAPRPAPEPVVVETTAAAKSPTPRSGITVFEERDRPSHRSRNSMRPSQTRSTPELEELATDHGLARRLRPMAALRAWGIRSPLADGGARDAAHTAALLRCQAVAELARSTRPQATSALIRVLVREGSGPLLDRMVAEARRAPHVGRRLARLLRNGEPTAELVTGSAMIGGDAVDRALRDAVTGDIEATELAAAAVQRVEDRPRRIELLLALWADLETRGLDREPAADIASAGASPAEARARRWFAGLPRSSTGELVAQAETTRHAVQRRRCLLALAARADESAAGYLLEVIGGRRFEESLLAAYALAHCPADAIAALLGHALRSSRRPELLLAALVGARTEGAAAYVDELRLTEEEHRFLLAGNFDLAQFEIAAALFRNRHDRIDF